MRLEERKVPRGRVCPDEEKKAPQGLFDLKKTRKRGKSPRGER